MFFRIPGSFIVRSGLRYLPSIATPSKSLPDSCLYTNTSPDPCSAITLPEDTNVSVDVGLIPLSLKTQTVAL